MCTCVRLRGEEKGTVGVACMKLVLYFLEQKHQYNNSELRSLATVIAPTHYALYR